MIAGSNRLQIPDYIVLVGYFALIFGVGIYFYRHMKGMKDFFSGGNTIPWRLSGVSFYMSSFSVAAFVGYSSIAYKYGMVAVTLFWTAVPATLFSVMFFAKKWRRARIDSPVEYLEARYGSLVRQLFAWEGLPVRIIDDALKLVATAILVSAGLGLDIEMSLYVSGLVMLSYTLMGGLWAVAVTDFIQFVVMFAAIVILAPISVSAAGGFGAVCEGYREGFFDFTHPPEYDLIYVLAVMLLMTLAYSSINWSLIQRYYCVPKEKDALKVGGLVMFLFFIGPPLILLPAMLAPRFIDVPEDQDRMVYALLCLKLLPPGMMGLIIAAMFAATMSTLSADYNVCAAVLTNDVYRRLVRPNASQRELVLVGRLATFVIGILVLGAALAMINITGEGLFRGMVQLFSVFTAPVAIPMILGLLWRDANRRGALWGFLAGAATGLMLFFLLSDENEIAGINLKKETLLLFATTAVTTAFVFAFSCLQPSEEAEKSRADSFLHRLTVPVGELAEDSPSAEESGSIVISPFRVVGICVMLIGAMMLAILSYAEDRLSFGLNLGVAAALLTLGGIGMRLGRPHTKQQPLIEGDAE